MAILHAKAEGCNAGCTDNGTERNCSQSCYCDRCEAQWNAYWDAKTTGGLLEDDMIDFCDAIGFNTNTQSF